MNPLIMKVCQSDIEIAQENAKKHMAYAHAFGAVDKFEYDMNLTDNEEFKTKTIGHIGIIKLTQFLDGLGVKFEVKEYNRSGTRKEFCFKINGNLIGTNTRCVSFHDEFIYNVRRKPYDFVIGAILSLDWTRFYIYGFLGGEEILNLPIRRLGTFNVHFCDIENLHDINELVTGNGRK